MLAVSVKGIKIDKVYSSDLKRAYRTAEIIFKDNSIEKMADFREINFGIFEGLKYDEIMERYTHVYESWIDRPLEVRIPEGENFPDMAKRVRESLCFILSENRGRTIAVVTHGGPIRVILCDTLGFDLNKLWEIKQDNGAVNIIDYSQDSQPEVVKMNDVSHLRGER